MEEGQNILNLHFCLKFVVITQSASQVTQQETLATGGNTKCTCLSAVPQCSFFTSLLYASVCLGGIYEFHYTSKTTLLRYNFFYRLSLLIIIEIRFKSSCFKIRQKSHLFFSDQACLAGGTSVGAFHGMTPHWCCDETGVSHTLSGLTLREGWAVHRHLNLSVNII